jgi:hypothetical protein
MPARPDLRNNGRSLSLASRILARSMSFGEPSFMTVALVIEWLRVLPRWETLPGTDADSRTPVW